MAKRSSREVRRLRLQPLLRVSAASAQGRSEFRDQTRSLISFVRALPYREAASWNGQQGDSRSSVPGPKRKNAMAHTRVVATLFAAAFMLVAGSSLAVEPYQEYHKRVESAQTLTALSDDLMGDSVSLYNGATEFSVVDIDLPGNNQLPVQLRRRFSIEIKPIGPGDALARPILGGAANWDVDVPYISGTFDAAFGWAAYTTDGLSQNAARRSLRQPSAPPIACTKFGKAIRSIYRESRTVQCCGLSTALPCLQMALHEGGQRVSATCSVAFQCNEGWQGKASLCRRLPGCAIPSMSQYREAQGTSQVLDSNQKLCAHVSSCLRAR